MGRSRRKSKRINGRGPKRQVVKENDLEDANTPETPMQRSERRARRGRNKKGGRAGFQYGHVDGDDSDGIDADDDPPSSSTAGQRKNNRSRQQGEILPSDRITKGFGCQQRPSKPKRPNAKNNKISSNRLSSLHLGSPTGCSECGFVAAQNRQLVRGVRGLLEKSWAAVASWADDVGVGDGSTTEPMEWQPESTTEIRFHVPYNFRRLSQAFQAGKDDVLHNNNLQFMLQAQQQIQEFLQRQIQQQQEQQIMQQIPHVAPVGVCMPTADDAGDGSGVAAVAGLHHSGTNIAYDMDSRMCTEDSEDIPSQNWPPSSVLSGYGANIIVTQGQGQEQGQGQQQWRLQQPTPDPLF